jgi:hypothetical protein
MLFDFQGDRSVFASEDGCDPFGAPGLFDIFADPARG